MDIDDPETDARYDFLMGSSLFCFTVYTALMITVLVLIRSKVQFPAIIIMGAYFFGFTIKATSDTIRAFDRVKSENALYVTSITSWAADRINVLTTIYLAFIVNEIKLKLESQSPQDFKDRMKAFSRHKTWIYSLYAALVLPCFVTYIFRTAFPSQLNVLILACIEFGLKLLFTALDAFLILRFGQLVLFFLDQKLEHIRRYTGKAELNKYQRSVVTIIFALIMLHFIIVFLDLAYPLQEILYKQDSRDLDPYTHLTPAGEYVGFFAINFLDFLSSLGYLYLFFKMGQKQLRETK